MELFTILLSSLLGLVAPVGLVIDRTAADAIRSQFKQVEQLQVRVDNSPSYQLLQGKVERVRIAGRGLQLKQDDIRIDALELETDPIDLNGRTLSQSQLKLNRPFQAGVRLVLTQQDINKALQSPLVAASLRDLDINLDIKESGKLDDDSERRYDLINPQITLLANNRIGLQVELREQGNIKPLTLTVESGLGVVAGRQIQLVKPLVYVNQEAITDEFVSAIANNLNQRLNLVGLDRYGLHTRILQLNVNPQKLEITAFFRLEPSSQLLKKRFKTR